jgi:hypothetical protein
VADVAGKSIPVAGRACDKGPFSRAAFHIGQNLRRDRFIRDKLRGGQPPWRVEELTAKDLGGGEGLVNRLIG